MNFRFIKEKCCPICAEATIIKEELDIFHGKVNQHCNGGQWEKRTFLCGQMIEFIPNFDRSELSKYYVCRNNLEYMERQNKRKVAKDELLLYIDTLEVDDDFKSSLKDGHFYLG
ncbi:hypothetical protein EBB07_29030 [Paenibacillaceae bacterium]|nr:hypothetical protein EBB07_29030 [Paenibacillaceae bacterium]